MIRIVIADDHKLFRQIIADVINTNPDFKVIAQCENTEEAIEIVRVHKPDVVLMDINIKPFSGIKAIEKIKAMSCSKVIGLSLHSHPSYAKQMIRAGAIGYVTKNSSSKEIFTAISEAARGSKYICDEIKTNISDQLLDNGGEKPSVGLLTEREIEVIHLVREGFSSKEMASMLSVSLKTVEVHRHNILKKLKLKNSSKLVDFIYANAGML